MNRYYGFLVYAIGILSVASMPAFGQTPAGVRTHQPAVEEQAPEYVCVDARVLAAFVDEPNRHFNAAMHYHSASDYRRVAAHLRIAAAFLELESARAKPGRVRVLRASIEELNWLGFELERQRAHGADELVEAFGRAHCALAEHHCTQCGCGGKCERGCLAGCERTRIGQDMQAAATHLKHAARWRGDALDQETLDVLDSSKVVADGLLREEELLGSNVNQAVLQLKQRVERFTGHKLELAPPMTGEDPMGPSLFQ